MLKLPCFLLLFLYPLICFCQGKVFTDINLNRMEGIGQMNKLSYPCIEMIKTNNTCLIKYHIDKRLYYQAEYSKKPNYWYRTYTSKRNTSAIIYSYEYVYPVYSLTYSYTTEKQEELIELSIMSSGSEKILYFKKGPKFSPKVGDFENLYRDCDHQSIQSLEQSATILKENITKINNKHQVDNRTVCYEPVPFSFTWWKYFGDRVAKKIACK